MSVATRKKNTEATSSGRGMRVVGGVANYVDERTSLSGAVKYLGRKVFPDHWSFMLGEIALYSFVVILLSGTFLTFFFDPSMVEVDYDGSYAPLKGIHMSAAYSSSLNITFDIRGGLLMRQVHHWAALLFIAAIGLHMLRVFFTGAFRKPREINWVVGFVLFILAMAEGFTGYSLPDDLLSGNGLRIIDGMIKAIPGIGTWISFLLFGGEFPGYDVIPRLYVLHIMILPAMVIALIAIHMVLLIINKHTQFAGPGRTNDNVVGSPILPVFAAKAGGFFFLVFGVLMLIGSLFTINPIWNYGPYDPSPVSAGTQPDWYIGFADGMLRLIPPGWEFVLFGYTWSMNLLVPIVVLMLFLGIVMFYPFLEAWVTGDKGEHHIAERPRNNPTRTGIGAAGVTFYAVLWAGASSDIIATHFRMTIEGVILTLQILLVVGPFIAYTLAKRMALALQRKDRELVLHGYESSRIVRLPGGEYREIHTPLDEFERWKLVSFEEYEPVELRPNERGKITLGARLRSSVSKIYFEDRIAPVTTKELESAKH
jgi:ubiquinol-cytochrome c reductase cytochrome b subunit